ncbi:MAG: sugar transferase [Chloroflexi bacterium]|nr:sugar transferase [Chloroflexota bacterium]
MYKNHLSNKNEVQTMALPPQVDPAARGAGHTSGENLSLTNSLWELWDRILAIVGIILAAPVMLVLAILIKLDSPGPVLFRQTRVGKNMKPFTFYKFRTMYVDARQRWPELYTYKYTDEEINNMYFKLIEDPRITRMGSWMRRSSLDELPNFINVLKGEMAIVGPRPDLPQMLRYYEPWQLRKFQVKPGITGLAQANGRAILKFQQTLAYDVEYVECRSFLLDLQIVLKTVIITFKRVGAY